MSRCSCGLAGAFRMDYAYDCDLHGMLRDEPRGVLPADNEGEQGQP